MDKAHKKTDKLINETEKELYKIYLRAYTEAKKQLEGIKIELDGLSDIQRINIITAKKGRLQRLISRLAEDINNVNGTAIEFIEDLMTNVYDTNFSYEAYKIENTLGINISFTLYDKAVIMEIVKKTITPFTRVAFDSLCDKNAIIRQLTKELTSSLLLGESMRELSKRVNKVTNKKYVDSIRIARTEAGRVQNHARFQALKHSKEKGIDVKKQWSATADNRTRHTHRALQMEIKDISEPFSNGLMYPSEPNGRPSETINCRCTIIEYFEEDYTPAEKQLDEDIKNLSWEAWENKHSRKKEI